MAFGQTTNIIIDRPYHLSRMENDHRWFGGMNKPDRLCIPVCDLYENPYVNEAQGRGSFIRVMWLLKRLLVLMSRLPADSLVIKTLSICCSSGISFALLKTTWVIEISHPLRESNWTNLTLCLYLSLDPSKGLSDKRRLRRKLSSRRYMCHASCSINFWSARLTLKCMDNWENWDFDLVL